MSLLESLATRAQQIGGVGLVLTGAGSAINLFSNGELGLRSNEANQAIAYWLGGVVVSAVVWCVGSFGTKEFDYIDSITSDGEDDDDVFPH